MDLRGCGQAEAVTDFVDAVHEWRASPGDLAIALIELASGKEPPSYKTETLHRWGHLLALRGRYGHQHARAVNTTVRVRYGPGNATTLC